MFISSSWNDGNEASLERSSGSEEIWPMANSRKCNQLIDHPLTSTKMDQIIYGNNDDSTINFPQGYGQSSRSSSQPEGNTHDSEEDLEVANHRQLFGDAPVDDVTMTNRPDSVSPEHDQTDRVCADLQKKLALDPDHLKIALLTSKCPPEERHANVVFANAAFHQLDAEKHNSPVVHAYDDALKDFVRMKARMFLLIPSLEAYSNNPHKDGTLSKSLYYLTLLLSNVLETQRILIKGDVPDRDSMLASIYADLPPNNEKMSKTQIKTQVTTNAPMRIRMVYARLVMVYYYVHMPNKPSQWVEIDERLRFLRTSLKEFQQAHAHLVFLKDDEMFSHKKRFKLILEESRDALVVPTLHDVRASMASSSQSTR
ncbi:hypothetical protein PGT21_029174 [Puccinia graminis f. sp. tritici]|uniref:Uncharacterized protein n=1 Tax=Puccinia graminis f. sp. tritici TaxID=56615 RepID=A0A5B0PYY5_PUCGR|nr:hypothetical protein PGT21_029174 [Puccinia graminis f. sp. tritici]